MASGVGVHDNCITEFDELKLRKNCRFIQYKISDDAKSIEIERKGDRDGSYDDFKGGLPENECRYVVYDVEYDTDDGARSKLTFVMWYG